MDKAKKVIGPTGSDVAHSVAKGVLGAIPLAGGLAVELFNYVVTPPLEKRKDEWRQEIEERLKKLETEGVKVRELQNNPEFIDVVLQASQAVLRTSISEKKEALANAVINAAKGTGVSGAKRQMFLTLIDQFNEWHLRFLALAVDPVRYFQDHGTQWPNLGLGAFSSIIESAFPELRDQRLFYDIIWKDLSDRGLVRTPNLHTTGSGQGLKDGRASDIGKEFLAFIAE